jgi:hypothetical protein
LGSRLGFELQVSIRLLEGNRIGRRGDADTQKTTNGSGDGDINALTPPPTMLFIGNPVRGEV